MFREVDKGIFEWVQDECEEKSGSTELSTEPKHEKPIQEYHESNCSQSALRLVWVQVGRKTRFWHRRTNRRLVWL